MTDQGSSSSVLAAFLLGAMAGAAVALLYAPAPGEETRRRLAARAREGRQRAETIVRDGREFVSRQRDQVASAIERGREAFDEARKETL
jgi:gas vesicle protein